MQPFFIKRCYVKEISQNLHRLLSLAALVICIAAEVQAADYYGFKIGGVSVTSENCTNVTGSNITAYDTGVNGGNYSVSYDPTTNTVTLYNVKIDRSGSGNRAILNESCSGLTIVLKGQNYLKAIDAAPVRLEATTTIIGEGELDKKNVTVITGGTQNAITITNTATLSIRNISLKIYAKDSPCFYGASNSSDNPEDWATLLIDGSDVDAYTDKTEDSSCLCRFNELAVYNSYVRFETTSDWNAAVRDLASFTKGLGMYLYTRNPGDRLINFTPNSSVSFGWYNCVVMDTFKTEGVPVTASTFPDPNLLSFVDRYISNGNGYVTFYDCQSLQGKIEIINQGIASAKGLEEIADFIKKENIYYKEQTESQGIFDTPPLIQYITHLNLNNNLLTSLDLSKFENLHRLSCSNNQLTSLDLSACTELYGISCYGNNIRGAGMDRLVYSLPDRSAGEHGWINVKYEGLETDNEMTKAQVLVAKSKGWYPFYYKDDTREEYEGVDDVTESGIAINDITHFPDAAFRAVVASADIDLDQNGYLSDYERQRGGLFLQGKGIKNLQGIGFFEDLTRLDCWDNELTELDLSNNKEIRFVYFYGNNICGEAMDRLIESLPTRASSDKGSLFVICDGKSPDNAMTNLQVEAAKAKGWNTIKSTNDGTSWQFYTGEDVGFAIDEQHFPDENFRTYIQSTIDKDKNGYLSVSERQNVTSININREGIARVKGIEYFPNLEQLNCINNQLTSLNLEYNRKLKVLNCRSNQLTYLNISQNELLEELNCSSNQLTQLVFENNPNLKKIYIHKNKVRGDNMTRLVNSLPTKSADSHGYLYVFYEEDENTGNYMTYSQMAMAMEKHWDIHRTTDGNWKRISISSLGVAIDEGNFPDEVFRDYVKQYDTDKNGALSTEERKSVTEMDVNGNVADVTGIENFTALKTLEVDNQQLTKLDVSKLTELETLLCSGNQLTTLNLTKNTKLIHFTCSDNQLETLNLAKNTALTDIWCSNNQLTKLDVANNTALVTLDCSDNQLTSLNVAKNTALADLRCYNNQLTTLDLSTNVNLEYLECANNQLTSIVTAPGTPKIMMNCRNNQLKGRNMTDFVNNLPEVESGTIYFHSGTSTEDNEMTSAQVAVATAKHWRILQDRYDDFINYTGYLVELAIDEKNFPDANFRRCVGSSIIDKDGDGYLRTEEQEAVKSINVNSFNIADLTGIKVFTNLEELDCGSNQIATLGVSENTALKTLNCSHNKLTALNLNNKGLETLDCSSNQIEALVLAAQNIKEVNCSNNKLSEQDGTAWLIEYLPKTKDGKLFFKNDGDENSISNQQIMTANKNGWKVYHRNDITWQEFNVLIKGDADGDGTVDVNDVTTTINHILGKPVATFIPEAANVDGDDTIDVNDVQGIINIALGKAGD